MRLFQHYQIQKVFIAAEFLLSPSKIEEMPNFDLFSQRLDPRFAKDFMKHSAELNHYRWFSEDKSVLRLWGNLLFDNAEAT